MYEHTNKMKAQKYSILNVCKRKRMNIEKRLKHTDGGGGAPERKEYGANNPFRKNKIFKNRKN